MLSISNDMTGLLRRLNMFALILVCASGSAANAQSRPEIVMSTPNPTEFPDFPEVSHLGVRRDAIILYRVGSYLYKVPAPYVAYWMNPSDVAKENRAGAIDFSFWMPSKQPTNEKGIHPKPLFLDEATAEVPGGRFTVQVMNFKILEPGLKYDGLVLPEQRQKNYFGRSRIVDLGEIDGVLVSEDDGGMGPFKIYRNKPGDTPQFLFMASPDMPNRIVASMTGDVYFPDIKLSVFIKMSPRGISQWRETFQAIRDLGVSWIDKAASSRPKN